MRDLPSLRTLLWQSGAPEKSIAYFVDRTACCEIVAWLPASTPIQLPRVPILYVSVAPLGVSVHCCLPSRAHDQGRWYPPDQIPN